MRFKGAFLAIEIIVRSHPGIVRGIGTAVVTSNKNSRGSWMARGIDDVDSDATHGFQVCLLL